MREASFVSGSSAAKLRDADSSQITITYTSGGLFFSNKAVGEGQWYGGTKFRLWALTQGGGDRWVSWRKAFFHREHSGHGEEQVLGRLNFYRAQPGSPPALRRSSSMSVSCCFKDSISFFFSSIFAVLSLISVRSCCCINAFCGSV
jgi:hypothetical protein